MAIFLNNKVGFKVGATPVDFTDHVTNFTLTQQADQLEVTAMGDTAHKFVKGLEASTIQLDFLSDTAASNVNATLQAAWGTTVPLTLKQTNAATSATNPLFSTTVLVNNTQDINGSPADIASQSITFTCNSPIVITTS